MLNPDHQVDLPQQYTTARGIRPLSRVWKWVSFFFIAFAIILFAVIGSFPMLIAAIGLGYGMLLLVRRCQLRRALTKYRGKVCPCCWHPSDDPKPGCKGCESPASEQAHRVYWRLMRLTVVGAEQWFGDQFRLHNKQPPLTRLILCFIAIVIVIPMLFALYVVLMTVLFNDLSWISGMGTYGLFWVLYFPALMVSGYFARRRIGTTKHCTACEYQLTPVGRMPKTCPECGADITKPNAVSKGRQIGSYWGILIPIAVFSLVAFLPLLNISGGGQLSPTKLVPTQMLIDHVIATDDLDYQLEQELESRRLNDAQLTALLDEMQRRILAGVSFGFEGNDPHYWGMDVAGLISDEAAARSLSHKTKARLLQLSCEQQGKIPFDIEQLVDSFIQNGVFSVAELQAAEMTRPIKRASTKELVQQVLASDEVDWKINDELQLRSLDDASLIVFLDEMTRRLEAGQDFSSYDDAGRWGRGVGDLILDEVRSRPPSRSVSLRLLSLALTYPERSPASLRRWTLQAQSRGQLNIDEPNPEDD